ncbi:MAG: hypothetical protein MIO93_08255 [ANME-2 cluster archaeon]|nr:hypothetical protein [ANME-2 cluster archaeon]
MSSIPIRIQRRTKERIEKMQSQFRLKDVKLTQQQLLEDALEYVSHHEDDFISHITRSEEAVEEDSLWQIIHAPVDMGKTDARKVDEYLYGGE